MRRSRPVLRSSTEDFRAPVDRYCGGWRSRGFDPVLDSRKSKRSSAYAVDDFPKSLLISRALRKS
jgi:hypothetical protein